MPRETRPTAARPMKALAPCAAAADLEVVAGAEPMIRVAVEVADEVGVPVPVAVLETDKETPYKTRKDV